MRTLVITVTVATLAAGCCPNAAAPRAGAEEAAARRAIPGEYVFTVAPGTTPGSLESSLADLAPKRIRPLGQNQFLVVFGDDPGLSRLSFRIGNGQILEVQPNYVYKATR